MTRRHKFTYRFPAEWLSKAACAGMSQEDFFGGVPRRGRPDPELNLPGIEICKGCAVKDDCLDYALKLNIESGVFGGYTARQRNRLRKPLVVGGLLENA